MRKRLKKKHFSWHHKKPRSLGGETTDRNMVHVDTSLHVAWHQLFRNHNPVQIATIISVVWLDPDWIMVAHKRKVETPKE